MVIFLYIFIFVVDTTLLRSIFKLFYMQNCLIMNPFFGFSFNILLNPDIPYLCKQCRSRSFGFSRSALFVIQYENLYQQSGSSNLIG